jgi:hypothetical protein
MASGMSGADPEVMAAIDRGNAVVFFDIGLGDGANVAELGRIKLELFVQDVSESVWSMFVKLLQRMLTTNLSLFSVRKRVRTFDNFAQVRTVGMT